MAITVTEGTANTTAASPFDVTIPAHSAGDKLILIAFRWQSSSSAPTISTAGWTTDKVLPNATATNHVLVGSKTGDGSESSVRINNMSGGGTYYGKVYVCAGASGAMVGTADEDSGTADIANEMSVGTCAAGDAAFTAIVWLASTSAPSVDNGFTLDDTNSIYATAYKVLDSTDGSVLWDWTTSRGYRAALVVVEAATAGGGVPRVMFHRRMQGMA